jgi:hypothetical protein
MIQGGYLMDSSLAKLKDFALAVRRFLLVKNTPAMQLRQERRFAHDGVQKMQFILRREYAALAER